MAKVIGWKIVEFKAEGWHLRNHKEEVDRGTISSWQTTWGFG
jgi:hypothetical protein